MVLVYLDEGEDKGGDDVDEGGDERGDVWAGTGLERG
jgi:hypothetical protein